MNKAIHHRGPDASGTWINNQNRIYFGHQRLSIIDLSKSGSQPMKSNRGNAIVFNGEIYNFIEIKRKLLKEYEFSSQSDTEVLLALYEKFGQECLGYCNGMFAFAIWDKEKSELFLARDRAGQKPLYYTEINGIFAFSSEIKSLFNLPWIKPKLDEEALYDFLTFGKLPPPKTMFKNIHKFHPGYKMTVDKNGIKEYAPFWELDYKNFEKYNEKEIEELVFSGLSRSVKYRMVSDVPVGAFLSGGVDSSAIVALMQKNTNKKIKTFSIGFKDMPGYTELEYARTISKTFNTQHYERFITPEDIREFLPKIIEIFDEPLSDATAIPIYFISKLAKENGTKVVMTGDGGDELFAGYRNWLRYIKLYPYYKTYSKSPRFFKEIIKSIYGIFNNNSPNHEMLIRASKNHEFFWGSANSFKEGTKKRIFNRNFLERNKFSNTHDTICTYRKSFEKLNLNRQVTYIDWMCFLGFKFLLPNFFLFRSDRLGMANSVETRSPFMDHEFVNLALSIPSKFKIVNNEPKAILKNSLRRVLPDSILYRKKMGFCVPLKEWAGDILYDYIDKNLKKFCQETNIFDYNELKTQKELFNRGKSKYTNNLWTLYFLMNWFKKWIL
jgi:asparagine synthase (glutamine-hydrolysing)